LYLSVVLERSTAKFFCQVIRGHPDKWHMGVDFLPQIAYDN